MATVLTLINCLLLLFWVRLWADPGREFYFNPFLSGPIRLVDSVVGALGIPTKFTCLLMLAFGLMFRTAIAIRFGYVWKISLGSIFFFTPKTFAFPHLLVFSVLDFLLFIARLWTAYILIGLITPPYRRDRASQAFEFAVRPFSLLAPALRIVLLAVVHLLIALELHMLVLRQSADFQMLDPGSISNGVRSLPVAHFPDALISLLKLVCMAAASFADGLNAMRGALVTCVIGGLAALLFRNQTFRQVFAEGMNVILGRFARVPIIGGMMDFTPLIFFFAIQLIYSVMSSVLWTLTVMIS